MPDPKDVPPFTPEELQEKLRNGEVRMELAEITLVTHYSTQVRLILLAIGEHMGDDAEEWADDAFVSDGSSVGDFCLDDECYVAIAKELGVPFIPNEPIYAIAARMAGAN